MRPLRRFGCLAISLVWAVVFFLSIIATTFEDCMSGPEGAACEHKRNSQQVTVLGGELAILVAIGWLFYRREMKDDEF